MYLNYMMSWSVKLFMSVFPFNSSGTECICVFKTQMCQKQNTTKSKLPFLNIQ